MSSLSLPMLPPKRLAIVAGVALALIVLLVHSSASSVALLPKLPSLASFRNVSFTSSAAPAAPPISFPHTAVLLHEQEKPALPLLEAIADFKVLPSHTATKNVTVCAVPTHEMAFLPEWIVWHRLQGVDRFVLFDNSPSREMRKFLRPWLDEGSVILYEMEYHEGVNIGTVYQQHLLRLCERHVLPETNWAIHHDADEFLQVHPPGWREPVPMPSTDANGTVTWSYPLHDLLGELRDARCVPITRVMFQNVGIRKFERDALVTEVHTVRERRGANRWTFGKTFVRSGWEADVASWHGPHSCKPIGGKPWADNVILDVYGNDLEPKNNVYPSSGMPLPQEGLDLYHYGQRSLADCQHKVKVLADTPHDWRTIDGLPGCARNYIPLDSELSPPSALEALLAEPYGTELAQRSEEMKFLFVVDTRARDSWTGRMTRAVLDEWRRRARVAGAQGWEWEWELREDVEGEEEDLSGIVRISV